MIRASIRQHPMLRRIAAFGSAVGFATELECACSNEGAACFRTKWAARTSKAGSRLVPAGFSAWYVVIICAYNEEPRTAVRCQGTTARQLVWCVQEPRFSILAGVAARWCMGAAFDGGMNSISIIITYYVLI